MIRGLCVIVCAVLLLPGDLLAQKFDEKYEHWPERLTIGGRVIVTNAEKLAPNQSRSIQRLFPTDAATIICRNSELNKRWTKHFGLMPPKEESVSSVKFSPLNVLQPKKLQDILSESNHLAVLSFQSLGKKEITNLLSVKQDLTDWVQKGGTLLVDPFVATHLGEFSKGEPTPSKGLNLIPNCVLFSSDKNSDHREFLGKLDSSRPLVGVELSEDCLCVFDRRKVYCLNGSATFHLPNHNKYLKERHVKLVPRGTRRTGGSVSLIDLTQWRRMAIDRTLPQFPSSKPETPHVKNGTLVIVGGGGMPRGLMQEIVNLAGGRNKAKMVYVPCSEQDNLPANQGMVRIWKRMGVRSADFIHTKDRTKANTDKAFQKPLEEATGLWFGGGRQWNFSDSYYGTETHRLMKKVLDRGGVIGGSSAGASIQGRYLARATPIGNFEIMAPGYERGGLGFLSGVAIDQHFSQRRRQKDMSKLVQRYPQLLGIGIDEATAIIVTKSQAKVVGRGRVFFYDANSKDQQEFVALPAGSIYDLAERKVLKDARKKEAPKKEAVKN